MSVIKSKRNESGMEFIHNARTLQIYTIKKCVAFPKRYSFYMGQPIVQMATEIHNDVKRANSIYPLNAYHTIKNMETLYNELFINGWMRGGTIE